MDFPSEGHVIGGHVLHLEGESGLALAQDRRLVTIDTLPDDVLLKIFDFYEYVDDSRWFARRDTWHALVYVCCRWRYLVFVSPHRLNLRLTYYGHRPISEALDAWPVLPVSLISMYGLSDQRWDNMVAALESEHYNRISEIYIRMTNSRWERFAAAMQTPFPELTRLDVWTLDEVPVLSDSLLGGSAPRLRTLELTPIPFPSLPKLLLSARGLVDLTLQAIPDSGYMSPDAMATTLAVMTRLEFLDLEFLSPRSRPDPASRALPPPSSRFVLPALTQLRFKGVYEYLEDLLARIDIPHLHHLYIAFFMDLAFDVPQLRRLIGHGEFKTFDRVDVSIYDLYIQLVLYPKAAEVDHRRRLELEISCRELDYQLSSLAQVCSSSLPFISTLEELHIGEGYGLSSSHWKDDMENAQWFELLDAFTALKNLYLTDGIARRFCGAFQELSAERAIEVLPALRNLFVPASSLQPVKEAVMPFIAARQLSDHPVVVDHRVR